MERQASTAWYLLPVCFGLLGGIMSYIGIREYDKQKAMNCIGLGIMMTIFYVFVGYYLANMSRY